MPAGVSALTALATTTLASSSATVTFSSIPSTYRDLRLIMSHTNTAAATGSDSFMRVNGDTGSNYFHTQMWGNGSSALSATATAGYFMFSLDSISTPSNIIIDLMDYSSTDRYKSMLVRQNQGDYGVYANAVRWAGTAAITSITLTSADQLGTGTPDQFAAGSTFSLYGVSA